MFLMFYTNNVLSDRMGNIVINNVSFMAKCVKGDGNCFFRCLQKSVTNKQGLNHETLRHLACKEVANNSAVYARQLTSIQRQMESVED